MVEKVQIIKSNANLNSVKTTEQSNKKIVINFNGEIEPTKQSKNQIDCWLLSKINALNTTSWGKKAIKDAIKPDDKGGANVTFKDSPYGKITLNISIGEFEKAKASGNYSSGDDDMLALELATEKLFKQMIKDGKGKLETPSGYNGDPSLGNMIVDQKANTELMIDELLTGIKPLNIDFELEGKSRDEVLKFIANNPGKYASTCNFSNLPDVLETRAKNDVIHGGHLYAIKKITFGKEAIISDPYASDKEIRLPWDKFKKELGIFYISAENQESRNQVEKHVPDDYYKNHAKDTEQRLESKNKREKEQKEREKAYKESTSAFEANDICGTLNKLDDFYRPEMSTIQSAIDMITKDNVVKVLRTNLQLVTKLDEYKSGWGKGKGKKALIEPIITKLAQRAEEAGVDKNKVEQFKKVCIEQELNAVFYTNAKVLQKEVYEMQKLIEQIEK